MISTKDSEVTLLLNVWAGDRPEILRLSLSSIANQTLPPAEVLVVVDGPVAEDLEEIIENASTQVLKMKVIRLEQNHGLAFARNTGLSEATYDLLALHDADDVMHPRRIEIQRGIMKDPRIDVVCSGAVEFEGLSRRILGAWPRREVGEIGIEEFFWNSPIAHSSVMLRKSSVMHVGGYSDVFLMEDYDLWLRLLMNDAVFFHSSCVLQALAVDGDQHRRRGGWHFVESERILHRHLAKLGQGSLLTRLLRLSIRLSLRIGPPSIRRLAAHVRRVDAEVLDLETFLRSDPTHN